MAKPQTTREALHEVDMRCQEFATDILAVIAGARALLRPDPDALIAADRLLDVMGDRLQRFEDAVNLLAEGRGCSYVNEADHDRVRAIRALFSGPPAG